MKNKIRLVILGFFAVNILVFVIVFTTPVNGNYDNKWYVTPSPTEEIVSPTISPDIIPSCTPTPEISISPSLASPMPSEVVPTDTPETQIGSPASANNTPIAGQSATPYPQPLNQPTMMPNVGWK